MSEKEKEMDREARMWFHKVSEEQLTLFMLMKKHNNEKDDN